MIKKYSLFFAILLGFFLYSCSGSNKIVLRIQQKPTIFKVTQDIVSPPIEFKKIANVGDVAYKTSVFIKDGKLIISNRKGRLYVINAKNGNINWTLKLKQPVQATVYADKYIYVGTLKGELFKIGFNKRVFWKLHLGFPIVGFIRKYGSNIYVTTENNGIYCINSKNGSIVWKFNKQTNILSIRGASPLSKYGKYFYVGFNDGTVDKFSEDGNEIWNTSIANGTFFTDVDATVKKMGGNIYAVDTNGNFVCINASNGNVIWKRALSSYSNIEVAFFAVFFANEDGTLYALDPTGGEVIWSKKISEKHNIYSIYLSKNKSYIYALDGNGDLVVMNAINGNIMDVKHIGNKFSSEFFKYKKSLYIIAMNGDIYSIHSKD